MRASCCRRIVPCAAPCHRSMAPVAVSLLALGEFRVGLGGLGSGSGLGLGLGLGWAFGFEVRLEAGLFARLDLLAHLLLFHRLAQLSPELQQV